VKLMPKQDFGPLDTSFGTPLASLIALLGGPSGLAVSAATGFTFGPGADSANARLGADFVDDIRNAFLPGKVAVLSEIRENWTAPIDVRMEQIGGVVFRRSLSNVRHTPKKTTSRRCRPTLTNSKPSNPSQTATGKNSYRKRSTSFTTR
jgi:hypothetical protein